MSQESHSIDATDGGIGVEAQFVWDVDRFVHRLVCVMPEGKIVLWKSLEADRPAHPAFQELHGQHTDDGRPIFYLSGSAHGGHWSMSVEQAGPRSLQFDVACRVTSVQMARSTALVREASMPSGSQVAVQFVPLLAETSVEASDETIVIGTTEKLPAQPPATLRWKYAVRMGDAE